MDEVRLDKWLWAARFFTTRSMAAKAVSGGKVHLNGHRVKPSRSVQVGDKLLITKGEIEFRVEISGVNKFRRPASEARLLYEELEESVKAREEQRQFKKMVRAGYSAPEGRPSKRDRRKIRAFTRKDD